MLVKGNIARFSKFMIRKVGGRSRCTGRPWSNQINLFYLIIINLRVTDSWVDRSVSLTT